jgi:hypothetical protein
VPQATGGERKEKYSGPARFAEGIWDGSFRVMMFWPPAHAAVQSGPDDPTCPEPELPPPIIFCSTAFASLVAHVSIAEGSAAAATDLRQPPHAGSVALMVSSTFMALSGVIP